jgi:hypothetical protein
MSTALGIAAVTAVLKDLLDNGLIDNSLTGALGPVTVSALPPDRIASTDVEDTSRLNLFLYAVTPNVGWRNVALPSRNGSGDRIANPPLAVDLHYMLTAYGVSDLHTEILLGYGMQLLHETPVLTRDAIRRSLTPPTPVGAGGGLPPAMAALATSELADQVEQIKITPEPMNSEELSRIWSALQARYRPTMGYLASVVLIEGRRSTKSALPVRDRRIYVTPFRRPSIEALLSQIAPGDPIVSGRPIQATHRLVVRGRDLMGDRTRVVINGLEVTPASEELTDTQIIADLPAGLVAGVQTVQVVQKRMMGDPETEHRGVESNVAAFVLVPFISFVLDGAPTSSVVNGVTVFAGALTITFTPEVGRRQRVAVLLNQFDAPATAFSYSFIAAPRAETDPETTASLTVPFSGVRAGTYLVRVQVDGAESPLAVDTSEPPGPSFHQYIGPTVTIA